MTAPYADLIERLRDPHFQGAMQYLRGWTDLDDMHDDAAKAIEALQADNERLAARNVELFRLAHDWMVAHDMLAARRPYKLPAPLPTPPEGEG